MMDEDKFITISTLVCEPTRARMLWNLLDGRAYTAGELAIVANISTTSASNHLAKLLEADLLKVESQGRHRYFSFSRPDVAYVVESLASLANHNPTKAKNNTIAPNGVKYCRSCYDHMAGFVGVQITEALESKGLIEKSGTDYAVTEKGWEWLTLFDISKNEISNKRRPLAKQCLDWSERRPHLAGQVGALILIKMLEKNWFKKVQFSRELVVTSMGRQEIYNLLDIKI
jgi:DNA-binding transcriptional ArsR family regulator